jgi:hypothetical protein
VRNLLLVPSRGLCMHSGQLKRMQGVEGEEEDSKDKNYGEEAAEERKR